MRYWHAKLPSTAKISAEKISPAHTLDPNTNPCEYGGSEINAGRLGIIYRQLYALGKLAKSSIDGQGTAARVHRRSQFSSATYEKQAFLALVVKVRDKTSYNETVQRIRPWLSMSPGNGPSASSLARITRMRVTSHWGKKNGPENATDSNKLLSAVAIQGLVFNHIQMTAVEPCYSVLTTAGGHYPLHPGSRRLM